MKALVKCVLIPALILVAHQALATYVERCTTWGSTDENGRIVDIPYNIDVVTPPVTAEFPRLYYIVGDRLDCAGCESYYMVRGFYHESRKVERQRFEEKVSHEWLDSDQTNERAVTEGRQFYSLARPMPHSLSWTTRARFNRSGMLDMNCQ